MADPYPKTLGTPGGSKRWSAMYADALPLLQLVNRGVAGNEPTPKFDTPLPPEPPPVEEANRAILAEADKEYADRQAAKGFAETGVKGATPLSSYMETIFGPGMGAPGYGSAQQHLTALQAQGQDLQQLLGQQRFESQKEFEQKKLAQEAELAREHNATQLQTAALAHSPEAMRAQLLLRAALDPSIDLPAALERMTEGQRQLAQRYGVNSLAPTSLAPTSLAPDGHAGNADLLGPQTPPLPPGLTAQADRIIGRLQTALGATLPGSGPRGIGGFELKKELAPEDIFNAIGALQSADLGKNPALVAELQRRIHNTRSLGDVGTLTKLAANRLANDLIASGETFDPAGNYAGSYESPGLLKLTEERPDNLLMRLPKLPAAPAQVIFGPMGQRALAGGVPYNRVTLPNGFSFEFKPEFSPLNSVPDQSDVRRAQAKARLNAEADLMRLLLGTAAGSPAR